MSSLQNRIIRTTQNEQKYLKKGNSNGYQLVGLFAENNASNMSKKVSENFLHGLFLNIYFPKIAKNQKSFQKNLAY